MTDASVLSEKPPRMLIADDDPSIVRLLADRCASVGFEVDTATNGIQALIKADRRLGVPGGGACRYSSSFSAGLSCRTALSSELLTSICPL
jgi:hypothetical protein